jgi:LmbE family N-acetylglucosaminyl deacetylase
VGEADIVITASPVDYHPDHETTSMLVRDACFASSVPNYATGPAAPLAAIPHLYFMDPSGGRERDGTPVVADFGVDISDVFETKAAMLSAHESQHAWVARQHAITDHLGAMRSYSAKRGPRLRLRLRRGVPAVHAHALSADAALQELLAGALRASS